MGRPALLLVLAPPLAALVASAVQGCWLTIDDAKVRDPDAAVAGDAAPAPPDGAPPPDGSGGGPDGGADAARPPDAPPGGDAALPDAPQGPCPTGAGTMILVTAVDGGSYCVDATEVTYGDYAKFLAFGPSLSQYQPQAKCASWNTDYTPLGWSARPADQYPVQGADWCDAYAYCAWAGKHLCGAIGGGGALDPGGPSNDAVASEWFNACSARGTKAYPYGNTYDGSNCIDVDRLPRPTGPALAGQTATCVGGSAGLFDMSGNVAEWEDACFTGGNPACTSDGGPECDLCRVRGGSYTQDAGWVSCAGDDGAYRNAELSEVGFRCCAN